MSNSGWNHVADNRRVKRSIKQLQRIKTWQLLILLLLMAFVAATFLRINNIGMIQRREAVLQADRAGDAETMTDRLYDLQRYTAGHMNANTGTFYLENQYKRDVKALVQRAQESNDEGDNILAKADATCRAQFTGYSQAYTDCVAAEQAKYPPSSDPLQNVKLPSTSLYRFSYISPLWSPDFAGWSVLACLVIALMIVARLVSLMILRLLVKRHYRGI